MKRTHFPASQTKDMWTCEARGKADLLSRVVFCFPKGTPWPAEALPSTPLGGADKWERTRNATLPPDANGFPCVPSPPWIKSGAASIVLASFIIRISSPSAISIRTEIEIGMALRYSAFQIKSVARRLTRFSAENSLTPTLVMICGAGFGIIFFSRGRQIRLILRSPSMRCWKDAHSRPTMDPSCTDEWTTTSGGGPGHTMTTGGAIGDTAMLPRRHTLKRWRPLPSFASLMRPNCASPLRRRRCRHPRARHRTIIQRGSAWNARSLANLSSQVKSKRRLRSSHRVRARLGEAPLPRAFVPPAFLGEAGRADVINGPD